MSQDEDVWSLDSDALDESGDERRPHKRKTSRSTVKASPGKKGSATKKRRKAAQDNADDEDEESGLKEGQEIVGTVVQAPKTGRGARTLTLLLPAR